MNTRRFFCLLAALLWGIASAHAGNLDIAGDLTVASNLTAHALSLGGETRTNWPADGGTASVAMDLSTPVLDFSQAGNLFRFTLTNHAAWVFTNHVAGRELTLQLAQDDSGGWTNSWPADLLWPGGLRLTGSTAPNRFDLVRIVDDGEQWFALAQGSDYRIPCVSNCSYALQFDGSQNYMSVPPSSAFYSDSLTIEAWVKVPLSPNCDPVMVIAECGAPDGTLGPFFYVEGRQQYEAVAFVRTTAGDTVAGNWGTPLNDDTWHHVAMTWNGSALRVYTDGVQQSQTWSGTASIVGGTANPFSIGHTEYWSWQYAQMTIDEIRVSSVVRYTSTFTPAHSFAVDSDTVAYWRCNEGDGSTLEDETGNHAGTLQGNPTPTWVEGR
jgi:hypothetical protein